MKVRPGTAWANTILGGYVRDSASSKALSTVRRADTQGGRAAKAHRVTVERAHAWIMPGKGVCKLGVPFGIVVPHALP